MKKLKKFKKSDAQKLLPNRSKKSNKTHGGRVLILAGSKKYMGAGILTATAAARTGAGYTTLVTDLRAFPIGRHPDFLIKDLKDLKLNKNDFDAVAVGPGFGVSRQTEKILKQLIQLKFPRVVVDADALTLIAQKKIFPLPPTWILTPHQGEFKRLAKPNESLQALQKRFGCVFLLKGHLTQIQSQTENFQINSGTPALAKSGTGDVLTGIIAALLAQGLSSPKAAALGAHIHGFASQLWLKQKKDVLSLMASDLLELLPLALHRLRKD